MNANLTPLSLACFAIAVAAMFGNLVFVATRYASLPEKVPMHYGFSGKPDAWGDKKLFWLIMLIPVFTTLLTVGVAISKVTVAKASDIDELHASLRILSTLAAYLSVGAFALMLRMIAVAEKHADGIGRLALPIYLAGLALVIVLFR
ncbi:MAG TPA: DUF1648 domain-containing protein [Candidatus Krumholzibacteria bacterium]|nr:DUF1648 domain-containing protein [Candidatus Krumholzibacteria bacterium]